jgi:hypothetical protein
LTTENFEIQVGEEFACAEVSSSGSLLVCDGCREDGCRDIEAPIAGVLVIDHDEEAWALCGACIRRLPLERTVV